MKNIAKTILGVSFFLALIVVGIIAIFCNFLSIENMLNLLAIPVLALSIVMSFVNCTQKLVDKNSSMSQKHNELLIEIEVLINDLNEEKKNGNVELVEKYYSNVISKQEAQQKTINFYKTKAFKYLKLRKIACYMLIIPITAIFVLLIVGQHISFKIDLGFLNIFALALIVLDIILTEDIAKTIFNWESSRFIEKDKNEIQI